MTVVLYAKRHGPMCRACGVWARIKIVNDKACLTPWCQHCSDNHNYALEPGSPPRGYSNNPMRVSRS